MGVSFIRQGEPMHPEDLARKINCTRRKIARLKNIGDGGTIECQRYEELLERLIEEQEQYVPDSIEQSASTNPGQVPRMLG